MALSSVLLFIPVPVGFLEGKIHRAVHTRFGLDVDFREAWMTVASGRVELVDVSIRSEDDSPESFHVGRIELSGPPEGLLFRRILWPHLIEIDRTSPIRATLEEDKTLRLPEPFTSAIETVKQSAATRKPTGDRPLERKQIPAFRVLHTSLILEDGQTTTTMLSLSLESAIFSPDPLGSGNYRVEFGGILLTDTPAHLEGAVRYFASDHLWESQVTFENLDGTSGSKDTVLPLWWQIKKLIVATRVSAVPGRPLSIGFAAHSDHVEVTERSNGSYSLYSDPLEARGDLVVPSDLSKVSVRTFELGGPNLEIQLGGDVETAAPNRFLVDLAVSRIPPKVFDIARKELASSKATFEIPSTSTLRLEAHAEGRADQLTSSTVKGVVTLDEVRLRHPLLRQSMSLRKITGDLTGDGAELRIARWQMGDLQGSASASMAGLPLPGGTPKIEAEFNVTGPALEMVRIARDLNVVPPVIERVDGNLRGEGWLKLDLAMEGPKPVIQNSDWSTRVSWVDGTINLTEFPDPIELESGAVRVRPKEFNLVRMRTRLGNTEVHWEGTVTGDTVFWKNPNLSLSGEGAITVPALAGFLDIAGEESGFLQEARGDIGVEFSWNGSPTAPKAASWVLNLLGRDLAFNVPTLGDPALVHNLNFDARITSQTISIGNLHGEVEDILLDGDITADEEAIRMTSRLQVPVETFLRLMRSELAEFRGYGVVPITAEAALKAQTGLPSPENPLLARWIEAISQKGAIRLTPDAPLLPVVNATLLPDGAAFWHEEMPKTVTNIRGRITGDTTGLQFHGCRSQWGDIQDVIVDGRVIVGKFPVRVEFDIKAPRLDILPWTMGWGNPPDGIQARRIYRDPDQQLPEKFFTILEGRIVAEKATLNRIQGKNLRGFLHYENWRGRPNTLTITQMRGECYDGVASGSLQMFVEGGGAPPRFDITGQMENVDIEPFLAALFGKKDQTVGKLDGYLHLRGHFGELDSFKGEGSVLLRNTRVLGGPVFPLLGKVMRATVVQDVTFTDIRGAYQIANETIQVNRLFMDSPGIRLFASGDLGFQGELDMEVTVGFFSQTLNKIPGFSTVTSLFRQLGSSFLKFEITGSLVEPKVNPVPLSMDLVQKLLGSNSKNNK